MMSDWLNQTVLLLPNWKWLSLGTLLIAGWVLKSILSSVVLRMRQHPLKIADKNTYFPHLLKLGIEKPISWIGLIIFWKSALGFLELSEKTNEGLFTLFKVLLAFHLLRLAYLAVEALGFWLDEYVAKTENTLDDQLAPLATKTLKVFVVVFGILLILQNFGFNVVSVLAGLGLGGLALTLAAQDTAANVFGSIQILFDRPFQKGDLVKIGDTEGIIEEIGFRSTRIRTPYNSLVSIPNASVAKDKIDNLGARQSRCIRHVLGLTYETPEAKIEEFTEALKQTLSLHPLLEKDTLSIRFQEMGDFNLQIVLLCFVKTLDLEIERQTREEILLECLRIAKKVGVDYAYPTQTHFLKSLN